MTDAPPMETAVESGLPRRIAFCITDLDVGGAEQCLVNVACGLDRTEWSPHVFCLSRRGALVDRLEAAGIPWTCLDWRGWRDAWRIAALAKKLQAWRPELLQTFLFHGNMAGRIAGALARVPVIVSGIRVAERQKTWHVRLERLTRGLVTHHVCVSQAVADFSMRAAGLHRDTISVISNGVDVARFADAAPFTNAELGAPPSTRWIITVGRLHPQKGHALLIEAVAPLLKADPDWRVMIVGEGPLRGQLERQIEDAGCRDRIALLGFRDDVPRLLKSASLFVLPSLWEGQPNVVLEALAAGLPVVATDVEGVRELLAPAGGSIVIEKGNVVALRNALQTTMSTTTNACGLRQSPEGVVFKHLTSHGVAAMYANLYRRLLQESSI